ncbi:DUF4347 domain-containing protein, partial [Morganella morganii]|nr:DUF4347 domain-containing protein [Morganella morganii]
MLWINVPKAKPAKAFNRVSHAPNARNLWCALATAVQCAYAAPMLQFIPAPHASTSVASIAAKSNLILVFVDSRVPDADQLLMNIAKGTEVIYLNPEEDGLQQIARALVQQRDIQSIQIISHGDAGQLQLGNGFISSKNLNTYANELQTIKQSLRAGGDILLFGCDVGAGAVGQSFVNQLALATGADVAASINKTGNVKRGGDWELEIATGAIKSTPVMSLAAMNEYESTLHTASVNSVAQLKAAIATGNTDGVADTITLTGNITFASAADAIAINVTDGQAMSIVGGGFTLSGNNQTRVLDVSTSGAGSAVAISNLTISNGFLTGAGGNTPGNAVGLAGGDALGANIRNTGTLTITNSTITGGKAAGG